MKLYRGTKTPPMIMTPKMEEEFKQLNEHFEGIKNLPLIDRLRDPLMLRRAELGQLVTNFFTNDPTIAEYYAGKDGYVTEIDVDEKFAKEHYEGEQQVGDHMYSSNFVLSGRELFDLNQQGKIDWHQMRKEDEIKSEIKIADKPIVESKDSKKNLFERQEMTAEEKEIIRRYKEGGAGPERRF